MMSHSHGVGMGWAQTLSCQVVSPSKKPDDKGKPADPLIEGSVQQARDQLSRWDLPRQLITN